MYTVTGRMYNSNDKITLTAPMTYKEARIKAVEIQRQGWEIIEIRKAGV